MTIKELEELILKKRYLFQVVSDNPLKKNEFGWKTLEDVDRVFGGLDKYLRKVSESRGWKTIDVALKGKNGTSYIKRGVFSVEIDPVDVGSTENQQKVNKTPTETTVSTNDSTASTPAKKTETTESAFETAKPRKMEDVTVHINNAELKSELRFTRLENDRLKESNKKLEQKNEELFNEVMKLNREISTSGAKHDIEFQKKELELMQKQKGGLSGIVEDFKAMPEGHLVALLGMINPKHPMVLNYGKNSNGGGRNTDGIQDATVLDGTKHEDADTQTLIEDVYKLLVNEKPAVVGLIAALVEYFVKYPDHLQVTFKKWYPKEAAKMEDANNNTNSGTDTDDDD